MFIASVPYRSFDPYNQYRFQDEGPILEHAVIVFDKDGIVINRWGNEMFYLPHGIHVDHENCLWITDVALHQVFKFDWKSSSRRPTVTLGERFKPGSSLDTFCKPSAVASTTDGLVVVADGYCNNRIMLFRSSGKFVSSWPLKQISGVDFFRNSLHVPHDLSIDEERKLVYVADRENGRVVIVDFNGTVVGLISDQRFGGAVYGVAYCAACT
ncbi:unnamed protein product [Soboliphyme baturini]|uniref:peptidylamidoglycolate lyase n=1 Tax=Soboliphyme baturini TaxID=241478 RepID=A0A3P8BX93_9BILA|nr:unnamed protein product [Soboliphyme baturini]